MSIIADARQNARGLRPSWRRPKMDYKEKLQRKAASFPHEERRSETPERLKEGETIADRIHDLSTDAHAGEVVFQSVAVTALQILDRVLRRDQKALKAALSLGQREKLKEMMASLEVTARALQETLSEQGAQMLDLSRKQRKPKATEDGSWWFTLTEAVEALEDGSQQMDSLAAGQPEDSAARRLSELVAYLLHQHHGELLFEAEQWIS